MVRQPLLTFVAIALLAAASAATAAPIPPLCQPAVDAEIKLTTTTHRMVMTEGNPPTTGEAITAGGVNYIKVRDRWMKSPVTPQESLEQQKKNINNATSYSCTRLADDNVDGAPATVYKVHTETPDVGPADAQIWLSRATGLPLRVTTRDASVKYEYTNIKAPVVQ